MLSSNIVVEFDRRHGSNGITCGGWIMYADGSTREQNPAGALISADELTPFRRHQNRKLRAEVLLRRATTAFDDFKQDLKLRAKHLNTPAPNELKQLKELQSAVRQARRELKLVTLDLEATPEAQRLRRSQQADADAQRASEDFLKELSEIEV